MSNNDFRTKLAVYKRQIDADIAFYSDYIRESTLAQYGPNARLEIDAFLDILARGGKRIRGALTMCGYEMSGGTDTKMIQQAARAVEMLHAYLLIIDDIQDHSTIRRGGPTAHVALADYHKKHHLKGSAEHFGTAMAMSAAMAGAHAAIGILANLNVEPLLRANTVSIMNRTLIVTHHGQVNDIMNEATGSATEKTIEQIMEWKTATYSFLNPLHVGMVLAGADCHATDAITPYAKHLGVAFQITDDILGVFGNEKELGKSPMSDIQEGKITLLMHYALQHVSSDDKKFLVGCLGNSKLTQDEFERCKTVLTASQAVQHTANRAQTEIDQALQSLTAEADRWPKQHVDFLCQLARFVASRTA